MKQIAFLAIAALTLVTASYESDMDKVYMLPEEPIELDGAATDITLSELTPSAVAMTLYWSGDGRIQLSDTNLAAPVNAAELAVELADNDQFLDPTEVAMEKGAFEHRFFNEDFNKTLIKMGYPAGVAKPLWLRIRSKLAENEPVRYSNVLKVNVTTYRATPAVTTLYVIGENNQWDFQSYLTIYDKETRSFGGVQWIECDWGYRVAIEKDNWDASNQYTATDGSTWASGTLQQGSDPNIPKPDAPGLYVMDFRMLDLSYNVTKVEKVSVGGINNNWDISANVMTQSADNPEVFTYEFVKSGNNDEQYGIKVSINERWDLYFGKRNDGSDGESGKMYLWPRDGGDGFGKDEIRSFDNGDELILTVDLGKQTYKISRK